MGKVFFISGIDTDCGKTYITSQIARLLLQQKKSVITQKLVQTGCKGISEDIIEHRRIMGISVLPEDIDGITCPFVFSFASSPHVAAELEGVEIDVDTITECTKQLKSKYEIVLLEGAGGLCVPITKSLLTIDYIAENSYPLIFVTSSKLGSINHTILSLELCKQRGIQVYSVIFNELPDADEKISESSFTYIGNYISNAFPEVMYVRLKDLHDLNI